jgi:hypothetical protein
MPKKKRRDLTNGGSSGRLEPACSVADINCHPQRNRMADAVLEILKVIQGDIAGLKTDMSSVKADLGGVKTEVRVHSRTLDILLQEGRLLRAAVNDFAKENVTPGGGSNPPRP